MSVSSELAYTHIKAAILDGRYRSGARLPEDMVASELGVSRTPIRDAIRRLQAEQLVIVTPYSGARVASWSQTELREIADLRVMLEAYAAGLSALKHTPAHLARLEALCGAMESEAARPTPDLDRISKDNLSFHRVIAESADNIRLLASLEPLWNVPLMVRKYGLFGEMRLRRSLVHHREMVAAIAHRDADWAKSIMRTHILAARAVDSALETLERDED